MEWLINNVRKCVEIRSHQVNENNNESDDENDDEGRYSDFYLKPSEDDGNNHNSINYLNNRVMQSLLRAMTFISPRSDGNNNSSDDDNMNKYWRIPPTVSPNDLSKLLNGNTNLYT